MQVSFWKLKEDDSFCQWEADRGKRRRTLGPAMPGWYLPHDLAGMIIEAKLGLEWGFWSCVQAGATFRSTERKRTQPGLQVIKEHKEHLDAAERMTHHVEYLWRRQKEIAPDVRDALNRLAHEWSQITTKQELVVEWPSLETSVREIDARVARVG